MKGINYLAALGTILVALGFYCFKAAVQKQTPIHGSKTKLSSKIILLIGGIASATIGIFLIIKAIRNI